jgi:hypothetical protein
MVYEAVEMDYINRRVRFNAEIRKTTDGSALITKWDVNAVVPAQLRVWSQADLSSLSSSAIGSRATSCSRYVKLPYGYLARHLLAASYRRTSRWSIRFHSRLYSRQQKAL